uniref:MYND-type zinc finger protein samB n=1 Tax=Colletotrichum fructicola (strain Nara gc5) TaxID=1213859 RepID=L2FKP3_COLFN
MPQIQNRWNGYEQEKYYASDSIDSYSSDDDLTDLEEDSVVREFAECLQRDMNMTIAKRRLGQTEIKKPDDCSSDLEGLALNTSPANETKDVVLKRKTARLKDTDIDKSDDRSSHTEGRSQKSSPDNTANANKKATEQEQVKGLCTVCQKKRTSRKCALCNDFWICSLRCQKSFVLVGGHFAGPLASCADHFKECVLNPKTTASLLYIFAAAEWLPYCAENFPEMYQRVVKDYRFDVFDIRGPTNRECLLRFYWQAIYQMDVSAREIHLWREEGKLFERIAVLCQSYPNMHGYWDLQWFKQTPLWESELISKARATIEFVIARQKLEGEMEAEEWIKNGRD